MKKLRPLLLIIGISLIGPNLYTTLGQASSADTSAFVSGRASFALAVHDFEIQHRIMSLSLLPGEAIDVNVPRRHRSGQYAIRPGTVPAQQKSPHSWTLTAPRQAGSYAVTVHRSQPADSIRLNIFVLVPFNQIKKGYLNGYRIGDYPSTPLRGLSIYKPPAGFIEVTRENENMLVSPHFRLKQFLCKQSGGYPKYVVLRDKMLIKLEYILERVNERGYRCDTFHVMSGYRTPYYNKAIGNVKYSRHVWGGAADIFIDENPRNGVMDDLNGDGVSDWRDAKIIYDLIDEMYSSSLFAPLIGGLGRYDKAAHRGPFVHVDVRGTRARWGR